MRFSPPTSVLVHLGSYNKRPQAGWPVNNINVFLTVLETGESKIKALAESVSSEPSHSDSYGCLPLCPHMVEVAEDLPGVSFIRALMLPHKGLTSRYHQIRD